ncbi:MAG: phosphate ABC transporter substrate-binding protein PstS [Actinomycetota bacterium]|nr:phosphate ABC transporter substrate-binding protein PstS [Actinomycetota bacterium]
MNPTRRVILVGMAGISLIAVAACGSDNGSKTTSSKKKIDCAKGEIAGAGSTFQQNIEQEWIKAYAAKCAGAQINYQGTGSGAGIEQFGAGTIDFAGSDVTMKPEEQTKADGTCGSKAIHVPVTAGGIAIMYNVKDLKDLNLSAKTLAGIFQGTIKKWNDPAIAADNPGNLPATPIAAYHRSDGSGTTSVFSGFLDANASGDWKLGTGKQLNWTGGQGAKGSDGVTAGVKQTDGAITYVELSFAKANNLSTAKVKGAGSDFVALTGDTVGKFLAASFSITGSGNDLGGKLDFKGADGYPISTVSYVIVCEKNKDAVKGKLIKAYLAYAVGDGQAAADSLGFAALPSAIGNKVKASAKALS